MDQARTPQSFLVILVAHGEAEGRGFRENYAVSWRTLDHAAEVMPLPRPLRVMICALGALRKRLGADSGSRHNALTLAQAKALESALSGDPATRYQVIAAFASSDPDVATVLATASRDVPVLLCSLIPTDSRLSCGVSCRDAAGQPRGRATLPLGRLWDDAGLVAVHRAHIAAWLQDVGDLETAPEDGVLIIALHGTLIADKSGKPPGFHNGSREKTCYGEAIRSALAELPGRPWQRVEIAYLNHAVGGQWSQPALEDCLADLARQGLRCAYVYPAEHLVESVETARLAQTLAASPLEEGRCLPCLNESPLLIDFLADRVRSAAAKYEAQPCDHCPLAQNPSPSPD